MYSVNGVREELKKAVEGSVKYNVLTWMEVYYLVRSAEEINEQLEDVTNRYYDSETCYTLQAVADGISFEVECKEESVTIRYNNKEYILDDGKTKWYSSISDMLFAKARGFVDTENEVSDEQVMFAEDLMDYVVDEM